ncbi:MAG TPA: hypothetical protein VFE32_14395 [Puia sp.]|jgi:hypothetical protein|nr:hypothetical protein [Puia sp.]
MSFKRLLLSSLWLGFGATLLPGCAPLSPSVASTYDWPTHGNQYYNYWDAKYLGSDSADQLSYRLIDSATFADIRQTYNNNLDDNNAIRSLVDSSRLIAIDSTHIQADLQWIKDSSVATGREYQVYLFIDRTTATISSAHGDPGTNHDSHPYIESDRNHGTVSPIPADGPRNSNRILIGQVHGHPARPGAMTLHCMSPDDSLTAVCLQTPIYAIDAMDGSKGTPGFIHRANPDPGYGFKSQDLRIGKTWGAPGTGTDSIFDIGLNALHIWGVSQRPNFEELKRIDSISTAASQSLAARR